MPGWKFPPSFGEEFEAAYKAELDRRKQRGEIPISRQQLVERWLREAMRRRGG